MSLEILVHTIAFYLVGRKSWVVLRMTHFYRDFIPKVLTRKALENLEGHFRVFTNCKIAVRSQKQSRFSFQLD